MVLDFLSASFKSFVSESKNIGVSNEKGISHLLCIFLNRKAKKYPFFFHSEYVEDVNSGMSPQVDIAMIAEANVIDIFDKSHGENDSFFSIEAKRLPTPGQNRRKEYVVGITAPCGGIERFKKGIHGAGLRYAAIVAYVQENDNDYWFNEINKWIKELADETLWFEDDQLKWLDEDEKETCGHLISSHARQIKGKQVENINLYHYWLNLPA
ncbi:hypothetical protein KHS38_13350 [Mucilaginibacter sp. Bleaf8]|uniref:hypothetical protein n=1 Tax=Mucilaginibacter sp. Bleaf8 TaxID=2834430 RepID=UPI001BCDF6C8|nr:hypothetical protein [Mucilaginibacter sp. Bleaf8]MBS7565392.1 hypothetical protein [Mucilaginibacter sp. Bleaf8]